MQDTRRYFNPLSITAHWLTLALLAAVYALIELKGIFPKGSAPREAMKDWHFMLGMVVFGLVFVRLALRAVFTAPPVAPAPALWQQRMATAMHVLLYAFLLAMPLLGWLTLNAKGGAVPFFGYELPMLLAPDRSLAHRLEDVHEAIGTLGYALVGVHAAAALFHHYFMRDNTLALMWPWAARAQSTR
ncbi:MAG: cytochrome b [Rubrivivax sp.]|nr:cytochrome b [Rubrivivax sp.]